MIEFTIKTLDSNNHTFSVDDEITIQQLKQIVMQKMGISTDLQRLIFCGRVMQDEKKLAEYDVAGKVVHLVQRAPPSPASRHVMSSSSNAGHDNNTNQFRRVMMPLGQEIDNALFFDALSGRNIVEENYGPSLTPTGARMDLIRRLIAEIKLLLQNLSQTAQSAVPNQVNRQARIENPETRRRFTRMRTRRDGPRELADLIEELDMLQELFAPFKHYYMALLRASYTTEDMPDEQERQRSQEIADMTGEVMHNFAHAYHALSDISYQMGIRMPRVVSEPLMRHPMPMQAHINVISNRRPQQPTGDGQGQQPPQAEANREGEGENQAEIPMETPEQGSASARNVTHPTVSVNIQPDPITYQVEIETRVPIAFALDNTLWNGLLGNNQPAATPRQAEQNGDNATVAQPPQPQAQPLPQSQPAPQQSRPQNQRDFLFAEYGGSELENQILRNFGQTAGVEVVMRMEEIPPPGSSGATAPTANAEAGNHQGLQQAHILAAPFPWGGPPTAEFLENIVSTVIRRGFNTDFAEMAQQAAANQTGNAQPANQQVTGQTANQQPLGQATNQQAFSEAAMNQPASDQTTNQQAGNQQEQARNSAPSGGTNARRSPAAARAQPIQLRSFSFDRFLPCDSHHARRRFQRRRVNNQEQANTAQQAESQPAETITVPSLLTTLQVIAETVNEVQPTGGTWINDLLITIARDIPSENLTSAVKGDETHLSPLRDILRHHLRNLVRRLDPEELEFPPQEVALERLNEYFVKMHMDFIRKMCSTVQLRADVDIERSIRALALARIPPIVSAIMVDNERGEPSAPFYALLKRLMADVCQLLLYCCRCGTDGLHTIYKAYMHDITRQAHSSVQKKLVKLGMDNLDIVMANLCGGMDTIQSYVIPRDGSHLNGPIDMDISIDLPREGTSRSSGSSMRSRILTRPSRYGVIRPPIGSPGRTTETTRVTPAVQREVTVPTQRSPLSLIPSMPLALTHFEAEAIPILEVDQERQRQQPPQPPYSDAYLSGMPSRKRRRTRQQRPANVFDNLFTESLAEAAATAGASGGARTLSETNGSVRSAFGEHIRTITRARAALSEDFDPVRYPATAEFARIANIKNEDVAKLNNKSEETT